MAKPRGDRPEGDLFLYLSDANAYKRWREESGNEFSYRDHLNKAVICAIKNELTEKQNIYFTMYAVEGLSLSQIASKTGHNKSTVSRTITRAKRKLCRCLKYAMPWTLNADVGRNRRMK